jgi:hypothetical protein
VVDIVVRSLIVTRCMPCATAVRSASRSGLPCWLSPAVESPLLVDPAASPDGVDCAAGSVICCSVLPAHVEIMVWLAHTAGVYVRHRDLLYQ